MPKIPSTPKVQNQMHMTGPNRLPTLPVPRLCTRKSPTTMISVIGTT